jgi:DNA-directed RNA polymerase subunit N (RpoN/RPB10)
MIIPIRCFTCGKVLADKWIWFKEKRDKSLKTESNLKGNVNDDGFYSEQVKQLLDELELKRACCRRHMITHVDLIDEI